MPRTGRPKKSEGDKLDARVELRLTASEKADFERAAGKSGVSLSEWLRTLAKRIAGKDA